ncbi:MAG: glycosyltransferase [Candidatus Omnitrophota bacterium]
MKILQVIHGFDSMAPGGTEVYTKMISRKLSDKHQVCVFHRICRPELKEYSVTKSRQGNIEIASINMTFRKHGSFVNTYSDPCVDAAFGRLLDDVRPDIVHIQHLMHTSTGIAEQTKQRNIPIVLTLHDYWLLCPQGQRFKNNKELCGNACVGDCIHCVGYQLNVSSYVLRLFQKNFPSPLIDAGRRFYQALAQSNPRKSKRLLEDRRERMLATCGLIDLFLAPSQFIRHQFIEAGVPKEKIIHLPHGIPEAQSKAKSKSESLRFAFIGNLLPAKGAHVLIKSFNQLHNSSATLKIFGQEGSYKGRVLNYPRHLRRSARNKNISFQPPFEHNQWQEVFRDIDVLIVPSLWHENAPLVILEALATNTPVLATNTGGIPELLCDLPAFPLVRPDDAEDLLHHIRRLIDHPKTLGARRAASSSVFSMESHVLELEKIFSLTISSFKDKNRTT